jgi:hypothetical protein
MSASEFSSLAFAALASAAPASGGDANVTLGGSAPNDSVVSSRAAVATPNKTITLMIKTRFHIEVVFVVRSIFNLLPGS